MEYSVLSCLMTPSVTLVFLTDPPILPETQVRPPPLPMHPQTRKCEDLEREPEEDLPESNPEIRINLYL